MFRRTGVGFGAFVFVISPLLASCIFSYTNKRTNEIVAGEYWGTVSSDESIVTYLKLEEIEQEVFEKAQGVNVIKDEVGGGYYSIVYTNTDSSGDESSYDFVNLKDAYDGSRGTLISYVDENGAWFTPFTGSYALPYPAKIGYYAISIPDEYKSIVSGGYLYPKGD